jgi:hypothetical protein
MWEGPQLVVVAPVPRAATFQRRKSRCSTRPHFALVEEFDPIAEGVDRFLHVVHVNEVAARGDGRCAM